MKKISFNQLFFSLICTLAASSTSGSVQQVHEIETDINSAIIQVISAEHHPYINTKTFSQYKDTLDELYFLSPQHLIWIDLENPEQEKINSVLQLLSLAKTSGLDPEHYNLTNLQFLLQQLNNQQLLSHSDLAQLDTAISINLLHLLSDLHFGRINPQSLNFNFDSQKNSLAFISLILKAVKKNEISSLINKVEPSGPAYQNLKKVLFEYREKETGQSVSHLKYMASIRLDESSPQIVGIRQQLKYLGVETVSDNDASILYDQQLFNQIKKFQFHHGLKEDGIIGKNTIKALNISLPQHIQKIELALERFRWLPKIKSDSLVMVNIPAFKLWAYQKNEKEEQQTLTMKVIVGKSKKRKSPVFTANMYYLEFSPYWNIPRSITIEEILPKLQKDSFYLEQHNMELVEGFHNNENAAVYTDEAIEHLRSGTLKLRQRPGRGNALGKVKFIFPNNYNVYLHDTPSRHLFNKSKRDLSHGCIRVEKPKELAQFLLKSKQGWNQNRIKQAMHLPKPKQVRLKTAVPVIIYYSTASIVGGEIVFYNDIYNYDAKLSLALKEHSNGRLTPLAKTIEVKIPPKL